MTVNGAQSTLLVAAFAMELRGLLRWTTGVRALDWPVLWARAAELEGSSLVLVANGAGRERAAEAVKVASLRRALGAVVSAGFCGGLDERLQPGDVLVANQVGAMRALAPRTSRAFLSGELASTDRVAQTREEKRRLRAQGAAAVEMEAAGVAGCAAELGVPFFCVRVVTDTAEESFGFDFNAALRQDGRFDGWRLLRQAAAKPAARAAELARLRRRSRLAASRLGEFLADCRF